MLTHTQLVALHRSLSRNRVLSVYLDGTASDPALQRSWHVQLDRGIADVRRGLENSSPMERAEFEVCVRRLDTALSGVRAGIGAPGWAAFITKDGIQQADRLPAPAPTLVAWSMGPSIAPYTRALKEQRPVIIIVADARRASIYRYHLGKADRVEVIQAHQRIDPPAHMGTPARLGFHSGTRGSTARDAAQRSLLQGRARMIADTVERVHELAGTDAWILAGGIKAVAAQVVRLLEPLAPGRATLLRSLDVHASEADIAEIARSGASKLRDQVDDARITEILDLAGAHGLGAVGPAESFVALQQSSVRDLFITHRYLEDHLAEAEKAIRAALDQDAWVEEVSGPAAERLNQHGGMAAQLRFRPGPVEPSSVTR